MLDIPRRFPTVVQRPLEADGPGGDPGPLLHAAVAELYASIEDGRRIIDLVEAATVDDEQLEDLWFGQMVESLVVTWADFLDELCQAYGLPPFEDPQLSARFVITNCTIFARLRHSDRSSARFPDDATVRASVITMIVAALLPRAAGDRATP
jgi:hypothetical protein